MKKYKVTRTETAIYDLDVWANTHEEAEAVANNVATESDRWKCDGYYIDYVAQFLEDGDE